MKKSDIYRMAAMAVMNDRLLSLAFEDRWEMLKQLMEDEKLALFVEETEAAL